MNTEDLIAYIGCVEQDDGTFKVQSRERADLEFKQTIDDNNLRKCVRTVGAFANTQGGSIVFGVTDSPRKLCGIDRKDIPDEAAVQDLISKHLIPCPEIELIEHDIGGMLLLEMAVVKANRQPVIATRDLQTAERRNKTILQKGVVYYRRAGQSRPITGEEFHAILERRDEQIRSTILSFLQRGADIGFENATIADFRNSGGKEENVTMFVPLEAAKDLNIIDKARLVKTGGAPAYEIRGSVALTTPPKKDPRKPLLPMLAARTLRPEIEKIFWKGFPWSPTHLRSASTHLGFWQNKEGDNRHTGMNEISGSPIYFELGRLAVLKFAQSNPKEFVDVVGSQQTKADWKRRQNETEVE